MMKANQSQKVVRRTLPARTNTFHLISFIWLYVIQQTTVTNGQLILRQDGIQNSYSVAAPGSQISFSRFYGGNAGQLLTQPLQQQQQQPLLYNQAPTQFLRQGQVAEQTYSPVSKIQNPAYIQNGQQLQEQYSPLASTNNFYTLELLRQQQQQEQLFEQQNHLDRQHNFVAAQPTRTQEALQYTQRAQTAHQPTETNQQQQLLGTLFSPSNEVSQVKFSSTGLNYSF